jgi:hypothetical protein
LLKLFCLTGLKEETHDKDEKDDQDERMTGRKDDQDEGQHATLRRRRWG